MSDLPDLKIRTIPHFPSSVIGGDGIDIDNAAGQYVIDLDHGDFATSETIPSSPTSTVLAYDTATGVYANVPISLFGGSSVSGAVDYPTKATVEAYSIPASVSYLRIGGYYAAGDGGGALYKKVGSEPSHAGKIQSLDGAWWELSEGAVNPYMFGGVGDGLMDDSPALQAAAGVQAARGGGNVDLTGGRWLMDSSDVVLNEGVFLTGPWRNNTTHNSMDYSTVQSALVINPTYKVSVLGRGAGLYGLFIMRKGMTVPTTLRESVDFTQHTFAGTAIKVGDGTNNKAIDSYVGYCMIGGFETAYWCDYSARPRVEYVFFDCTNGIHVSQCHDMNHLSHCHGWQFLSTYISPASYSVSAVNNNAGTCRLVIPAGHSLVNGDTVTITGMGSFAALSGRWESVVVGADFIDIPVAYAGTYTSGGLVWLSNMLRKGKAFHFSNHVDWGQMDTCFEFGWDFGYYMDDTTDVTLINCGADNLAPTGDTIPAGFTFVNNSRRGTLIGCRASSQNKSVVIDIGIAHNAPSSVDGFITIDSCHFWTGVTNFIHLISGRAVLTNSVMNGTTRSYSILVDPASAGITAIGNEAIGTTVPISLSGQALRLSTCKYNKWAESGAQTAERESHNGRYSGHFITQYGSVAPYILIGQRAGGDAVTPTGMASSDIAITVRGDLHNGTDFTPIASIDYLARGAPLPGGAAGAIRFNTASTGAVNVSSRIMLTENGTFMPLVDNTFPLGMTGFKWSSVWAGNGTIQTSDAREKTEVTDASLGLEFINALRPVSYKWVVGGKKIVQQDVNEDGSPADPVTEDIPGARTHWGLIAQEVKAAVDAAGVDFGGWILTDKDKPDSEQALRYDQFVAPIIKALQEISARVAALETVPHDQQNVTPGTT